jgi:translation initiation factor IF-3
VSRGRFDEEIDVPEVYVIGPDGAKLGRMPTAQALGLARSLQLHLIEVAPEGRPPVCRIQAIPRPIG